MVLRLAAPRAADVADRILDAERDASAARSKVLAAFRDAKAAGSDMTSLDKAWRTTSKGRLPADTGTPIDADIAVLREAVARVTAATTELGDALAGDGAKVSAALREVASHGAFREALAWQNRNVLHTALASLLRRGESEALTSRDRQHEELVANYLQRYCTKNDTIGFFGPVGWAHLTESAAPVVVTPGPALLSHRSVHFEQWAIDELAKKLTADTRIEPFLVPRRFPFVRGQGTSVRSAVNGKHELSDPQALVLAACNGRSTAREIAQSLTAAHADAIGDEREVFEHLRTLREKLLIAWTLEMPLQWNPDEVLRALLERIPDESLRADLLRPLDELASRRRVVTEASGDPDALEQALTELESTFTRLTGAPPTRNAGSMYAARQIVFEDCRRDLDASIGADVLGAIGPALSLLLTSGRWMTAEAARVYRAQFRAIHTSILAKSPSTPVPFAELWFRVQQVLFGEKDSPFSAVSKELERRWAEILEYPPDARRVTYESAALAQKVKDAFAADGPGWRRARHHSPDMMISAKSVEAIRAGDFDVVLGEIHIGVNTLDSAFVSAQHSNVEELLTSYERDLPGPLVMPVYSKDWLRITVRTNRAFALPSYYFIENGFDVAPGPRDHVLSLSDLVVHDIDGELVVRGPDGFELELLELLGENMSVLTTSAFHLLPQAVHTPRVTIDRLVVARETWQVMPSELTFVLEASAEARFLGARRWARSLGLPRFFFAKSTVEVKPVYVDLDSPAFVNMFTKLVRRTKENVAGETAIAISEMLPGLHETWVPDANGERYTSELRVIAVDEGDVAVA